MRLLVTYMELIAPPDRPPVQRPSGADVCIEKLGVENYLSLYHAVGDAVQWDQRLRMRHDELMAVVLQDERMIHFVLRVHGEAVGLCEYDAREHPQVELVNFGIVPKVQGRGLGGYFLDCTLRAICNSKPARVWLHTDTNDHPSALHVYERAGFRVYLRRTEEFPD